MHTKQITFTGTPLGESRKALIMLHGRGASAADILSLAQYLNIDGYSVLAPQAGNHTWYPFSFLSPIERNEPSLSSALTLMGDIVNDLIAGGVDRQDIYFLGFSQGACLALEFAARHAAKYGGIAALTGGLIGERINTQHYSGDFLQTPVFLGTSDPDPHVPVERVYATSNIFKNMNAAVTEKIYANLGHRINEDEIAQLNRLIFT